MIIKLGKLQFQVGGKKLEVKGDSIKVDGKDLKMPPICSICGCDARTCMHAGKQDNRSYDEVKYEESYNTSGTDMGARPKIYAGLDVANGMDSSNIVIVNGERVGGKNKYNLTIISEGDLKEVKADGSVTVQGNVGDIDCGGSVSVTGNTGDIDCGGSANIGGSAGDIVTGGSVRTGR